MPFSGGGGSGGGAGGGAPLTGGASGIATGANQAVALVAYNGTTLDALQVDGSKFLKVNIAAGTLNITGTLPTTLADLSGNNLKIGPKGNLFASLGGNTKGTAASNATTTLLTGTGQGGYALVTTTGSGIATIYDNTAGSGTVVAVVAANATAGTLIPIPFPLSTGLTVVSAASGPALTVTWTQ
jgi:hypothetical protein